MQDPYDILAVSRDATEKEIQAAYRVLAKQCHPDLNPGNREAEERFKAIVTAQRLLLDPEKRKRFDRGEINAAGEENYFTDPSDCQSEGETTPSFYRFKEDAEHSSIFSHFFGGKEDNAAFRSRGNDISYRIVIDFLDAAKGGSKRLTLPNQEMVDVKIPAGLKDGQTLRLKNKGMPGIGGGEWGDAYIECAIMPHAYFSRKDNDIHMVLPVTITEALLGGKVMVPTIEGMVNMLIPKGSNTGTVMRLKSKGIIDQKTRRYGDHYVTLSVYLPDVPAPELEESIRKWSAGCSYNPRKHMG